MNRPVQKRLLARKEREDTKMSTRTEGRRDPGLRTTARRLPANVAPKGPLSHRVGRLSGWQDGGIPLVDFEGNPSETPLPAESIIPLQPESSRSASRVSGQRVLLAFLDGDPRCPIIVGVVVPPAPRPALEGGRNRTMPEGKPLTVEALVDGKKVVIQGDDEIVLRCGQASLTLRRNGRVVVRGTYIETRSTGTNRIRGGTVEIN